MNTKLLDTATLKKLAKRTFSHQDEENTLLFCTIIELIQLAEEAKKDRGTTNIDEYKEFLRDISSLALNIINIDEACIRTNLFAVSSSEDYSNAFPGAFWPPGVEQGTPPTTRARRIAVRDREGIYWDGEQFYQEIETW